MVVKYMRVLLLNYEYPPLGGGAGNATFYLLQEFAKIPGLEVDLVTSSIGSFRVEEMGSNITIHYLGIHKKSDPHYQSIKDLIFYSVKAYFYSKKLIKKNSYDLSHSFFTVPCGFLSWLFFKRYKIPYIVSLRGADVPGYAERFSKIYKFIKPLIRKIWKDARRVVANSEGLRELARQTSGDQKIDVICNGVETEEFKPDFSARDKNKFVTTPGASRITSRKGLKYLIKAVAELAKKYPQISLEIVGDGSERKKLEMLVRSLAIDDKVRFIGAVPHEETAKYYQRANVFVLPSLNEGMSNAMLEALACGLPVITTNTGGAKELVQEGVNGFYVKMNDSQGIARKIEQIILHPALADKMSQESLKVAEKMSWENVASSYGEAYKSTIVPPAGHRYSHKKVSFSLGKKTKLIVKLAVMIGFISWIIYKVRWIEVLYYLRQVKIWQLALFSFIYLFGILLSSYKWKILANFKNIPTTLVNLFKVYLTGALLNNFFPSVIGGDTYRSYVLGKSDNKRYIEAASTVMADRITGFVGVMILIVVFSILDLKAVLNSPVLIIVNLLVIASFGTDIFLMIIRKLSIWPLIRRYIPSVVLKLFSEVRSYSSSYKVLGRAILWGVIYNFIGVGIAYWVLFRALGIPVDFVNYMMVISIISIVSALPISIGNIGVKEWSYITFFGIFNVNSEATVTVAIVGRFLQMIVNLFALPLYFKEKKEGIIEKTKEASRQI